MSDKRTAFKKQRDKIGMETICDYLKKQVEKRPEALAVFDEHRRLSFGELDALATTIARISDFLRDD